MSVILGIASSVLSNIISDLVMGKTKAAQRAEVEQRVVARLLNEARQENINIKAELDLVMEEIFLLSKKSPDLKLHTNEAISLAEPIRARRVGRKAQLNEILLARLGNLETITKQRRRELGLYALSNSGEWETPDNKDLDQRVPVSIVGAPLPAEALSDWELSLVPNETVESSSESASLANWENEMNALRDRIRRRRENG
jgi:hypothetical protein